jgi:outer membrane protein OmpA-like peptidoglycan-associated protein
MDKSEGGLASVSGTVRVRPLAGESRRRGDGPWLELALGPALTGSDVRASGEIGLGWGFAAGPIDLGPSLRYLHIHQPNDQLSPDDAGIALVGLEVTFFDRDAPAAEKRIAATRPVPARPARDSDGDGLSDAHDACPGEAEDRDGFEDDDGCPDPDNDGDRVPDASDKCPLTAEVENGVDDTDGCPDQGLFAVVEDRISLDEKVLFDTARARIKHQGRAVLAAIAGYVRAHPEFVRMSVEGHADERGPAAFNLELSRRRAERVKRALISLGMTIEIDVTGYGEARPRAAGHGERSWEQNRRVEVVLVRTHQVPAQSGPAGQPAQSAPPGKERVP